MELTAERDLVTHEIRFTLSVPVSDLIHASSDAYWGYRRTMDSEEATIAMRLSSLALLALDLEPKPESSDEEATLPGSTEGGTTMRTTDPASDPADG